jgi:ribose transport system substrate-binding protein
MRRNSTKVTCLAIGMTLALGLAGCGSVDAGKSGGVAVAKARPIKEIKVGFLQKQLDAPYFSAMVQMATDMSKKQGFQLVVQNANGDPVTQLNQAQTMLSQGVDVLIVDAMSVNSEKAQLSQVAKTVPVVFVDYGIPGVGVTSVTSNNAEIGRLSGLLTAERIGKGRNISVAILTGPADDEVVGPARQKGFLRGLTEGGVTYRIVASAPASWARDKAVPAAESMLAANPKVDLIIGLNDSMALGALTVLHDQGNKTTLVAAAADGQKEALRLIKDEGCSSQYVSTGLNSPALAMQRAMEIATQLATGAKKASNFKANEYTKAAGINCKNVSEFYNPKNLF